MCEAAKALEEEGAKEIYAAAIHPMLSGPAYERIEASAIKKVFVTDTIPGRREKGDPDWLKRLDVTEVFAEGILRIYREESVSSLFI